MATTIDKRAVLRALQAHLEAELTSLTASQQATHAGATHEEAKPENSKDTRALEQSYLARGLAARVAELREAVARMSTLPLARFGDDSPIALTALVTIEDEDGERRHVFIAPAGGGAALEIDGAVVRVITPKAPLARAMLGRLLDDEIERRADGRVSVFTVVGLS